MKRKLRILVPAVVLIAGIWSAGVAVCACAMHTIASQTHAAIFNGPPRLYANSASPDGL